MSTRRMSSASLETVTLLIVAGLLLLLPLYGSDFFVEFVMTRTMMLGIAASSVVFLAAYGGMISMAQLLMFGVAGFMIGNFVAETGSKGLKLGWNPWVAILIALAITSFVALIMGALASRTTGIYYLMLTFTYAVIGVLFFRSVVELSGSSGLTGIDPPALFDDHPVRQYYLGLGLSIVIYLAFRLIRSTPFGMVLQGIRDDPVRMASLGFNVPLHRTLAFTLAGFVAGIAGVLNVWWNGQIAPQSIDAGPTIDLLVIAVIGGISRLEGAWLGAFVFVAANNYLRDLPLASSFNEVLQHIPGEWTLTESTFHTWIGVLVLVIVVASPEGLMGIIDRCYKAILSVFARTPRRPTTPKDAGALDPEHTGS
ncbi:MAG: branched-chain amino acid ABC transporter permease [Acidimicrobiales bacterium]